MSRLQDDLQLPSAYADPCPGTVDLRETHISWVFLTDAEVYKVKKPVELGFLDFRSLEHRRVACEAEVRLNARLAPDVYLGVVPVCRGRDGLHRIGGEGELVDWAVRMRRLPDDVRADHLLLRHALGGSEIDAIASRLSDFHARADVRWEPEAVTTNLDENFRQMGDSIARYVRREEGDEIERWQRAFWETRTDLFAQRAAKGRVRDGHGDLRLEHVYLEPTGRMTILDCIEFNERFRCVDVCSDVAFLSMDLAWHGSVDLAERLLAAYAREANDFDLYALIDFYEGYRAYVRGKICHFLARDANASFETRDRAACDARRYFLLALSTDRRALLGPAVIAVGGLIASGKSTVATAIGQAMSAPVIDADRTRKYMVGVAASEPIHEGAWDGAYDPAFTERVYGEVLRRAAVVLASGRPVVLDASFRSAPMRHAARELASAHGVPFRFIECQASEDVRRMRLTEREHTRIVSDGRLAIADAFAAAFEPVVELSRGEHLVIDSTRPAWEIIAKLRSKLDTWPLGLVA